MLFFNYTLSVYLFLRCFKVIFRKVYGLFVGKPLAMLKIIEKSGIAKLWIKKNKLNIGTVLVRAQCCNWFNFICTAIPHSDRYTTDHLTTLILDTRMLKGWLTFRTGELCNANRGVWCGHAGESAIHPPSTKGCWGSTWSGKWFLFCLLSLVFNLWLRLHA